MYSRAGLVALFLSFLIAFTAAAPLPTGDAASPHVSLSRRAAPPHSLNPQPLSRLTVHTPVSNQILQSEPNVGGQLTAREVVPLERRRWNPFRKIRNAFRKIGQSIKHAAQKVGNGIKSVARKGVQFFKTNGAKIAKVGLKVLSVATKFASKVTGYIPGVGKALSKGLSRASSAADAASNRIHANIGGKLGKAMQGMDEAEKIGSYIPRALPEDYLEERDLEEFEVDARDAYDWDSLMDARDDYDESLYE